jgi:excisionase family DNA binding protein
MTHTILSLASYLRISVIQAYKLVKSGEIKSFNIGQGKQRKRYRIEQTEVDKFIERRQE